jgi:hypothetical protein
MSEIEVTPAMVESVTDMPVEVKEAIAVYSPPAYDQWLWYEYRHWYVLYQYIGSHGEPPHCPVCGLLETYWVKTGEDYLALVNTRPPWRFAPCCSERCAEWSMVHCD